MIIKNFSQIKDHEGAYLITFSGIRRNWNLSKQQAELLDKTTDHYHLPRCKFYYFSNDNGCYGFSNREDIWK